MQAGVDPEHVAVMYRVNRQARALEEQLRSRGVPYRVLDGTEFFKRQEIRTACAYLRLLHNPHDWTAFRRAVSSPRRGVGDKALRLVEQYVERTGAALTDVAAYPGDVDGLSAPARRGLAAFDGAYQRSLAEVGEGALSALLERLCHHAGLQESLISQEGGSDWRWQNVLELVQDAARFDNLALSDAIGAFLEHVALQLSPPDDTDRQRVTLLTMHSAKGLEWPHVYVCGLEEAVFKLEDVAEEDPVNGWEVGEARRLLYVAVTRAMDTLALSFCASRYNRFRGGISPDGEGRDSYPPLRFLRDLDDTTVKRSTRVDRAAVRPSWSNAQQRWQPARRRGFQSGQRVRHPAFGPGTVRAASGAKVTVAFDTGDAHDVLAGTVRPV